MRLLEEIIERPERLLDLREADIMERRGLVLPGAFDLARRMSCSHGRRAACEGCIDYYMGTAHESMNLPRGVRRLFDTRHKRWVQLDLRARMVDRAAESG